MFAQVSAYNSDLHVSIGRAVYRIDHRALSRRLSFQDTSWLQFRISSVPSRPNTKFPNPLILLLILVMSNFQSILNALDKYAEQTGINLNENPFADKVKGCESPNAVLLLLQDNLKAFKDYRDQNRKFIDCLSPVVQFVHAFSGVLGETAGLVPFQPAKLIFVGIDVLFTAADGVSASYDALLELFECLGNFLKRLHIYAGISLEPSMTDVVAKIMVELITILALARKQIHRGRLKQFAKKLLGDSEIETILKRLDRLTQEEARMTVAQTFVIVHGLLDNMKVVMDGGEVSMSAIRQTLVIMQELTNEINKMKRDQLQKDTRSWISPPDPSKNHIIARRTHYGESAVWCTRGPTFKNWDLTGGLLWIHGIRAYFPGTLCPFSRLLMAIRDGSGIGEEHSMFQHH
ncbi:hypothetical protein EDB86DRAFT_595080 [Lactarius hatsudake]|nr:hypothetical protein EDB86DRAFT_595080 [Lactarius hatsudake]